VFNVSSLLAATALSAVVIHAPNADLHLEVARTDADREYGLMNRTSLPPHTGMIFVFPGDGPVDFWMKNTLVSLDMVFVGADGTIRKIFSSVPVVPPNLPDASIPLEGGQGQYVIELPAGEAVADGLVAGERLDLRDVPPALPK